MKYIVFFIFIFALSLSVFAQTESLKISTVLTMGKVDIEDDAYLATGAGKHVGIGTTNTNERLTVDGVISLKEINTATPVAVNANHGKIYVDDSDSKLYFLSDDTNLYNLTATTKTYALDAADGSPENVVYVEKDGKVGIGTTVPGKKLNIGESTGANILLTREDTTTASTDLLGSILFDSIDSGISSVDAPVMINAYAFQSHGSNSKAGYLTFSTRKYLRSGAQPAKQAMIIAADGRVGVGTTAVIVSGGRLVVTDSSGTTLRVEQTGAVTEANAAYFDGNVIIDNGKVGIGTTAPSHTLTVKGSNNINPSLPEGLGLEGDIVNKKIGASYTVPNGKNLYIFTMGDSKGGTNSLRIFKGSIGRIYWQIDNAVSFASPLIVGEGVQITDNSSSSDLYITGIEVDAVVQPVYFWLEWDKKSYTVPNGKTLYILTIYNVSSTTSNSLLVDGIQYYYVGTTTTEACNVSFSLPLVVTEGKVLSCTDTASWKGLRVTGYLK